MPNPAEWYLHKEAREIIVPLFDKDVNEKRLRERFLLCSIRNSRKKEIKTFSVGYEVFVDDIWHVIVRYCNYHTSNEDEFHLHNKYLLPCFANEEKVTMKLPRFKTPTSQMRWSVNDISNNITFYRKQFSLIKMGRRL